MKLKYLTQKEYMALNQRLFFSKTSKIKFEKINAGLVSVTAGGSIWVIDCELFERFLKETNNVTDNCK